MVNIIMSIHYILLQALTAFKIIGQTYHQLPITKSMIDKFLYALCNCILD